MHRSRKIMAIANLMVVILVIVWNYTASTIGINGNTVASLSHRYDNLFTPAGYAFSIWGLIFIGLMALSLYMVKQAYSAKAKDEFILQLAPWLITANIGNATWLWVWLNEFTGLSIIVMLVILMTLIIIILKLNLERWDAPLSVIVFLWWPICMYSGWITVATIANIAAYLSKIGWHYLFTDVTWAVIMIGAATAINILIVYTRNMRKFASVGIWAMVAIAVRHTDHEPVLQFVSLGAAFILAIIVSIHGYQNRATSPFIKRRVNLP